MLEAKKHFLFDLDDTLINSGALHESAYHHALATHAPDFSGAFDYDAHKGRATLDTFRILGFTDEAAIQTMTAEKQADYRRRIATDLEPLPNAIELLSYLDARGREMFLVTGSSAESARKGLQKLQMDAFFNGVVTAAPGLASKPAPDLYLHCLRQFDLDPEQSVVIEDSRNGVEAARAAGLAVVGVHDPDLIGLCDAFFPDLHAFGRALGQGL